MIGETTGSMMTASMFFSLSSFPYAHDECAPEQVKATVLQNILQIATEPGTTRAALQAWRRRINIRAVRPAASNASGTGSGTAVAIKSNELLALLLLNR